MATLGKVAQAWHNAIEVYFWAFQRLRAIMQTPGHALQLSFISNSIPLQLLIGDAAATTFDSRLLTQYVWIVRIQHG